MVIATGLILLSPLSIVSRIMVYVGKQLRKNIVRSTGPMIINVFFMLNSADHEILMLDKSLINLLEEFLICRKFHCFCLSNQTLKFDFSYTLRHQ